MVDSQAEYYPFMDGHGHKGVVKACEYFEDGYLHKIIDLIRERGAKALYITGHSLGIPVNNSNFCLGRMRIVNS